VERAAQPGGQAMGSRDRTPDVMNRLFVVAITTALTLVTGGLAAPASPGHGTRQAAHPAPAPGPGR
jgi:hypothetical protein